jgi:mannose-6-phosphate isomerase
MDRVIPLDANRPADRFYRGGRRLAAMRGEDAAPTHEPEDWVASTTRVFGSDGVGETVLPDGRRLTDAIEADPVAWLGAEHVERWGSDSRLLVKLLDAGQRLPVHAHPDGEFAARHLARAHGKTEAWVILEGGTVHLGLCDDIDPAELAGLTRSQRTTELLARLHAVEVAPGDGILVPAGQLHAIGEGVLLLEVQEPEDLSILLEWKDFAIDGEAEGHLGLGFDTALAAVAHRALSAGDLESLIVRGGPPGSALPPAADPFFVVERVLVDEAAVEVRPGFAVLFVVAGSVEVSGVRLEAGQTAVAPAAVGILRISGTGEVLVSRPPSPSRG